MWESVGLWDIELFDLVQEGLRSVGENLKD